MSKNPFHLQGYPGAKLFCDRKQETTRLIDNINNDVNTTIIAIRRMGKTGLIHHAFNKLKRNKEITTIYIDIYATTSLSDLSSQIASTIMKVFPQKNTIGKKFIQLIKSFSPVISFDALTGDPSVSLTHTSINQQEHSLQSIFEFLDQQNKKVVIAIDEFQQIAMYPEKNVEHLFRSIIQSLTNCTFIFSGSQKHLLFEIFNSAKRPFFSSTQFLSLKVIDYQAYFKFIKRVFSLHNQVIVDDATTFILSWTRRHTYYTQALCNKIYSKQLKTITVEKVKQISAQLLQEQEGVFFQYRNLMTPSQWKLLEAIAKEDKVIHPTGKIFIGKYNLGNSSSVKRSLGALVSKEMVVQKTTKEEKIYQVYDCFLSRWLEQM